MRSLPGLASALLVLASFSARICAQAPTRALTVQNLAPLERDEWISCSVPFAEGAVQGQPALHVDGLPTVWEPFGARWPDGSVRQALCLFRRPLAALEEVTLGLVEGVGPELVPADAPGFEVPESHGLRFVVVLDGQEFAAAPPFVRFLEDNAARRTALYRGRIGTSGFVVELTVEWMRDQEHAYCGFGVFFSDPTTTALTRHVDQLAVESAGPFLFLRHTGPVGTVPSRSANGTRAVILTDDHLGDGQGFRRNGVLVPGLAAGADADVVRRNATIQAAVLCKPLAATSWVDSGAFGAFGHVPPPPPWLREPQALRAAMARKHAEYVQFSREQPGNPFRSPRYGLAASAHQAGEQADFGVVALEPVAYTGLPSFLFEVEWSVLQDGCRPVHNFEADARPLRVADHPNWVAHNGRTHYHRPTSPDRLGKTDPEQDFDAHRWFGKDNQHWSNNYLCAYYLLTGDPQIRLEIENEVQLYLGGRTLRPGIATSNPGAARAVGRSMLAATWLYLCTGDADLLERMKGRMYQVNAPTWLERDTPADRVRPFDIKKPDPRYIPGNEDPVWVPWEEALAVVGLAAYRELTRDDSEVIDSLVDGLALNLLRHGWRVREDGRPEVGYAMRLQPDHRPLTEDEKNSPSFVKWPSSSFGVWAMGSLHVGRAAAVRAADEFMVAWADDLLRRLEAGRSPPRDGFYDRFAQWDGVRITRR
ncbi:MAG: hypothetical protein O2865_15535 [Planctomycetota bacterium]|nr:hypothetical protein [Planctomycetota bacterium]MDA0932794.1 hypothetical protein [Planctomycetota bacterium]